MKKHSHTHPGEILKNDLFPSVQLTETAAAAALDLPLGALQEILAGRKSLTAALCLKIGRLFNTTPEMWMRIQANYDLQEARHDEDVLESLRRIVPIK